MRVLIAGSSGLLGSALVSSLVADGHDVVRLARPSSKSASGSEWVEWDPGVAPLDPNVLDGVDAIVNLCGHSIGAARWSTAERQRLRDSRILPTRCLAEAIAEAASAGASSNPLLLSGSAIGFYGDRRDEICTEQSDPGEGFLARLCQDWEGVAAPAEAHTTVTYLRTGLVLSSSGGFLERPLKLFRLGLGGRIGSGAQYWSWISLDDHVRAMRYLLEHPLAGPVNLTAPHPVSNREFTHELGAVLGRPTVFPLPRPVGRLILGRELADEVVFGGQRVVPAALQASGFAFTQGDLGDALRSVV